ncbi:hypothetical protein ANCCAN_00672 [Ancylostoma caninum]|uniref:Uncharacterized protein n=1 Tax=Ancylostoma caninum TaxID=29170 RepID=A0A368HBV8_ANCCA|nr:hypothetical protein ANCCAN_00672 [Ancylostoma caninum]
MGLFQLALLFSLAYVASSADKLWLADCEIQCLRSADRYRDLHTQYPKHEDMENRLIQLCEKADRRNRRIPVCDTAVALILNNWKAKKTLKVRDMDFNVLMGYCRYGCKKYGPK